MREAAVREVREETGLDAEVLRKAGDLSYWYVEEKPKVRVFKRVTFFLMLYAGGSTRDHDFAVDEARWFGLEQALRKMSYPGERKLLRGARRWMDEAKRNR